MKTKRIIFLILVFFSIVPYIGAAIPGLIVRTDPENITISDGGATVEYNVIIENLDDGRIDPFTGIETFKINKTITDIRMQIHQPIPDWEYTFDPNPIGNVLSDETGQSRTIKLRVKTKSGALGLFGDQLAVDAEGIQCFEPNNPDSCIPVYDIGFWADFLTEITGSSTPTPIPEFPTVALPIISVLGLVFLMSRKKRQKN